MLDGMVRGVLVSGLFMTGLCQAAAPEFDTATSYSLGDQPGSLIAADLNGDGFPDVAAVAYSTGALSVALNRGDGSFASATDYKVGTQPRMVIAADVDGDGDKDLVVACMGSGSPTIDVLKNDGKGVFGAAVSYPVASSLTVIAVTDVDGAKGLDVITGHGGDALGNGSIGVLTNKGDGTFDGEVTKDAGAGTINALALIDLNGDSHPDLLALGNDSFGDANRRFYYDAASKAFGDAANFSAYGGGFASVPLCAAAGDLNGDGVPDLVISNGNASISTLLSQTGGGFQQKGYSSPQYAVVGDSCPLAIVDMNDDGIADVLTPMMFMTNDGSGTLTVNLDPNIDKVAPNIKNETQTVAADIDGDSDLDVLSINGTTHTLTVRRNLARLAPDNFGFADVTGATPGTLVESASVVITGTGAIASIAISGGEYQINGGVWVSAEGSVVAGDCVRVRVTAPAGAGATASAVLTVGGMQRTFSISTASAAGTGSSGGGGGSIGLAFLLLMGAAALLAWRRDGDTVQARGTSRYWLWKTERKEK